MARLASEAKGGYYPTPLNQLAYIAARLTCTENSTINLFDPCCGTGHALRYLADTLNNKGAEVITYGIELEKGRAQEAKKVLDHTIAGGYENVKMNSHAISAMWLNPPYNDTGEGKRTETIFLRDLTEKRLQPGGLLMFCIPQHVLKNCANLLANRFKDIKIYRFTDNDYQVFNQVVVFGYRRKQADSGPKARQMREKLFQLAYLGPDVLPPLDKKDEIKFHVPPAAGKITLFRDNKISKDEIKEVLKNSTAFAKMEEMITPPPVAQVEFKKPVFPLKLAHLGTAIAAGAISGNMGTHIVKGHTEKIQELQEKDEKTIAQVEKMHTAVKIYSPNGIFTLK